MIPAHYNQDYKCLIAVRGEDLELTVQKLAEDFPKEIYLFVTPENP